MYEDTREGQVGRDAELLWREIDATCGKCGSEVCEPDGGRNQSHQYSVEREEKASWEVNTREVPVDLVL